MKTKRGFTLIELLVVIAVIGILAGIVLVSVRKAPDAAKDARIQSALTQVRSVAQMEYIDTNTYNSVCIGTALGTSTELITLHEDIVSNNGDVIETCYASTSAYCVKAQLKKDPLKFFCVDSTGSTLTATSGAANFCSGNGTANALTCAAD
jgi:prepilin-type N-terminal cleavage/methylation domain-containing protein